jgi:hypothetical protein
MKQATKDEILANLMARRENLKRLILSATERITKLQNKVIGLRTKRAEWIAKGKEIDAAIGEVEIINAK